MSKGTKINIGGRERVLRYDLNAGEEIEERLDVLLRPGSIEEDLRELANTPMPLMKTAKIVLWAGLIREEPELTLQECGSWVDFENVGEIFKSFLSQLPEMSPEAEESIRAALGADTNPSSDHEKEMTTATK